MKQSHRPLKLMLAILTCLTAGLCTLTGVAAASPEIEHSQAQRSPYKPEHMFQKRFILIDAGHGGIDGGTSYQDILEKDINLAIAQKLYLLLKSEGIPALLNRTGDYALSDENRWSGSRSRHQRDLAQRHQLSEELPIDIYISLHVNWGRHSNTRGAVVLHQEEGRSYMLASAIQQQLNAMHGAGAHHLPETGNRYYLIRKVKQPAVIVESGFISNTVDRELLTSARGQTLIAQQINKAILYYLYSL